MDTGLILVWDMDQTIIGNSVDNEKLIFNPNAIDIIRKAISMRPKKVTAIFLLTNNPADGFINMFHIKLSLFLRTSYVFDGIMTATDGERAEGIPKRLEDVKTLMDRRSFKYDETLKDRVYFFDDVPNHQIRGEIPVDNYIQITPPFLPDIKDLTVYTVIHKHLGMMGGNKKKIGRTRKLKRYGKYMRVQRKRKNN
jgi:hypothetical protein